MVNNKIQKQTEHSSCALQVRQSVHLVWRDNQKCYTYPSLRILLVSSSARLLVSVKMRDYSGKINKEHMNK